jgi:hypothetical protein
MRDTKEHFDEIRYALAPQMREYDRLMAPAELRWHPHIMFFHPEGHHSPVVNTDGWGFRYGSSGSGARDLSAGDLGDVQEVNLLVGGSVVFGLGCTGDGQTISSRLGECGCGHAPWLNLGGRGFTSTQELITFLLLRDRLPPIRHVVVLSGLNNLVLAGPQTPRRSGFGTFFFSEDFYEAMENTKALHKVKPNVWSRFWKRASHDAQRCIPTNCASDGRDRLDIAVAEIKRDVEHWTAICRSLGITISYLLQPFATWPERLQHSSESTMFDVLDKLAGTSSGAIDELRDRAFGLRFRRAIREVCDGLNVPFVDVNTAFERQMCQGKWLFVDRAHLTDDGCEVVARLISEFVGDAAYMDVKGRREPLRRTLANHRYEEG